MCRVNLKPSVAPRASTLNNRFRICKDVEKKATGQCLGNVLVGYYTEKSRIGGQKKIYFKPQMDNFLRLWPTAFYK